MKLTVLKFVSFFKKNSTTIYAWSFFILVLVLINVVGNVVYGKFIKQDNSEQVATTDTSTNSSSSSCNVLGINLHGSIYTYIPKVNEADPTVDTDVVASEDVISLIKKADSDDSIKAILIEVDSPGGQPVAGEEISNALKGATKPTVAVIRQSGTSAAYWAISGAGKIFASLNSDVGSIGVTASYVQNTDPNKKFVQISVGKYKDTGNPAKAMTAEEKALILRDIKKIQQNFINDVATNRNLSVDKVTGIADGSSMLGDKAKSLGLIDEIGDMTSAQKYLTQKIGTDAQLCW